MAIVSNGFAQAIRSYVSCDPEVFALGSSSI